MGGVIFNDLTNSEESQYVIAKLNKLRQEQSNGEVLYTDRFSCERALRLIYRIAFSLTPGDKLPAIQSVLKQTDGIFADNE